MAKKKRHLRLLIVTVVSELVFNYWAVPNWPYFLTSHRGSFSSTSPAGHRSYFFSFNSTLCGTEQFLCCCVTAFTPLNIFSIIWEAYFCFLIFSLAKCSLSDVKLLFFWYFGRGVFCEERSIALILKTTLDARNKLISLQRCRQVICWWGTEELSSIKSSRLDGCMHVNACMYVHKYSD